MFFRELFSISLSISILLLIDDHIRVSWNVWPAYVHHLYMAWRSITRHSAPDNKTRILFIITKLANRQVLRTQVRIYSILQWIAICGLELRVITRPETHCLTASKNDADNALSARDTANKFARDLDETQYESNNGMAALAIGRFKEMHGLFQRATNAQTERQNINCRSGGINYGLQLICQLDLDWDPFRCNLLAGSSSSFRVPFTLASPTQHPMRIHRELAFAPKQSTN